MALKAGYVGIKKNLKNKLNTIISSWDDELAKVDHISDGVVANTQLMKKSIGWINKNLVEITTSTSTVKGIEFTIDASSGKVTLNGTNDGTGASVKALNTSGHYIYLEKDKKVIISGGFSSTIRLDLYKSDEQSIEVLVGADPVTWTVPKSGYYALAIFASKNSVAENVELRPMITDADIIDQSFEPYTNEVAVKKSEYTTMINAILSAATDAADFAAFKTAMGAITPVTRSLSIQAPETREASDPEPEPETKTTKRSTKKTETTE